MNTRSRIFDKGDKCVVVAGAAAGHAQLLNLGARSDDDVCSAPPDWGLSGHVRNAIVLLAVGCGKIVTDRTSFITFRAWCKIRTRGPLLKIYQEFEDSKGRALFSRGDLK